MSELPNKKELEEAADKFSKAQGSHRAFAYCCFRDGAHYQHQISYAQGIKDVIKLFEDDYLGSWIDGLQEDVSHVIKERFAEQLRPLETLNDEQRSGANE